MLTEHAHMVQQVTGKSVHEVVQDVSYLRSLHDGRRDERRRIRDILDGGPEGIAALLGNSFRGDVPPVNNLIHSGLTRLAQKVGRMPDLRVDSHKDTQTARKQAEVRERIVHGYDEGCRLEMMLPQLGRWLPGYGFAPIVIHDGFDRDGNPFPMATLRDPFNCFPSSWGVTQQPDRIAFIRSLDARQVARLYPENAEDLRLQTRGGAVILGQNTSEGGGWEGTTSHKIEVAEYIDQHGTWTVACDRSVLLDFTPNPIAPTPPFAISKRFSFNKLIGHYDHTIGLVIANAKLNLLALIAMEDAAFAETVVVGELARGDQWLKGRNAVNYLQPGSAVQKLQQVVNPQMFQEIDRVERQLRTTANYSVIDDSQSPNSFVTGRGLDNLQAGVDNEVAEYQKVVQYTIEDVDRLRLMWDEKAYANVTKPLWGKGTPDEYQPSKAIDGRYRTRRKYGVMAGWDDPSKIVTGLQLLQAGIIDRMTFQQEIRGLDDVTEVNKRLEAQEAERALREAMLAAAQQGDPKAVMALIEMLPASDTKQTLQKFYTPQGQEMSPEEQAMAAPPELMEGGPESSTTILSRLLSSGEAQGGSQTVGVL